MTRFCAAADPIATAEAGDLAAIESAPCAEVEVLEAGAFLEGSELQQAGEAAIVAVDELALDQQAEALLEGEAVGGTLGELLGRARRPCRGASSGSVNRGWVG